MVSFQIPILMLDMYIPPSRAAVITNGLETVSLIKHHSRSKDLVYFETDLLSFTGQQERQDGYILGLLRGSELDRL
jgi:hypothetical protein